jgi:cytochrome b561
VTSRRVRFTGWQRVLHWLMAACILAMLFIGVGMVSTIRPIYLTLVSIHKPLGIAILMLALIRLALRLRYGAPSLPADLPVPMKLAAEGSHYVLYALMIAMPLLGWGMLSAAAYPVVLFGGWHLPAILPRATACMHFCGTRTSISPLHFLPWSCCMSQPPCFMHWFDAMACLKRWPPCCPPTRSRPPSEIARYRLAPNATQFR